jgi:hypothetical protein
VGDIEFYGIFVIENSIKLQRMALERKIISIISSHLGQWYKSN